MDAYENRTQQIIERLIAARYSFWSGMLTAHTVLLSAAVALLPSANQQVAWLFKLVGYVAILCMLLLLVCFAATKGQYEAIGQRLASPEKELTEEEKKRDIGQANLRFWAIKVFEGGSALGLFAAALLLGWVLTTP
jgi:Na+/melibiose symporter-like transporter